MLTNCLVCEKDWDFPRDGRGKYSGVDHASVCPSCLADARLGRLVRGLAPGGKLKRLVPGGWHCMHHFGQQDAGATPEEALEHAGVREVER